MAEQDSRTPEVSDLCADCSNIAGRPSSELGTWTPISKANYQAESTMEAAVLSGGALTDALAKAALAKAALAIVADDGLWA